MHSDDFPFRLKELLEHKKLSLQSVATALAVSRAAVHKWTRGGEIDYANLRKLAAFLEVNWVWLRHGEATRRELLGNDAQAGSPTTGEMPMSEMPMSEVRRKYIAELMESEARMKLAQETAGIVTWEWQLITDAVVYSSNVQEVYGRPINSNDDFWPHVHPDDIGPLRDIYRHSISSGQAHEIDFRIAAPDGSYRWIASRARPLQDIEGRTIKMVGISRDDSVRKHVEQRLQAVIAFATEGMALIGRGWHWEASNEQLLEALGYRQEALHRTTLPMLFEDRGAALQRWLDSGEKQFEWDARLYDGDGRIRQARVRVMLERPHRQAQPDYLLLALQLAA